MLEAAAKKATTRRNRARNVTINTICYVARYKPCDVSRYLAAKSLLAVIQTLDKPKNPP